MRNYVSINEKGKLMEKEKTILRQTSKNVHAITMGKTSQKKTQNHNCIATPSFNPEGQGLVCMNLTP